MSLEKRRRKQGGRIGMAFVRRHKGGGESRAFQRGRLTLFGGEPRRLGIGDKRR